MKIVQLETKDDANVQVVKIVEELGEVIQAIKKGRHPRYILEEINDVIQATMTLKFIIEPNIEEFNRSWEVTHMEKMLVRDAHGAIKIKQIHEM